MNLTIKKNNGVIDFAPSFFAKFKTISCTIALVLLFIATSHQSKAQVDTLFWFAAPNAVSNHPNTTLPSPYTQGDQPVELRIASVSAATTVKIDIPANPSFGTLTYNIVAGGSQSVDLSASLAMIENTLNNTVTQKGIRIRATQPITVYYEIGRGGYNSEIYSLKGQNALGKQFFTPFQTRFQNADQYFNQVAGSLAYWVGQNPVSDSARSSINIVATELGTTTVTFKLTQDARWGGSAPNSGKIFKNVTYTITLQQGETYSIFAMSPFGNGHMAGSEITADKKIAVTVSDDSVEQTTDGKDLVGDQLISVEALTGLGSSKYIVTKANDGGSDYVYITSTDNSNLVTITPTNTNISFTVTLSKGQTFEYQIPGSTGTDAVLIDAAKPVYVMDLSGFGVESGGPIIPPIQCTGSDKVSFVRSTDENFFLVILARTSSLSGFSLEGLSDQSPVRTGFTAMGSGTGAGWSFKRVEFSTLDVPVGTALTLSNSAGYFHLGIINGKSYGGSARYGYFSNFGSISSNLPSTLSACPNESITLDPAIVGTLTSAIWTNVTTGQVIQSSTSSAKLIFKAPASGSAVLQLALTDARDCPYAGQVTITAKPGPTVDLPSGIVTVCSNTTDTLIAATTNTVNTYTWSYSATALGAKTNFTATNASSLPNTHIVSTAKKGSGFYKLTVSGSGCTDKDSVEVKFNTAVQVNITDTAKVCDNAIPTLGVVNAYSYSSYKWLKGTTVLSTGQSTYTPSSSGKYLLQVVDAFGCTTKDSADINIVPAGTIKLNGNGTICTNTTDVISVSVLTGTFTTSAYRWQRGVTNLTTLNGKTSYKPLAGEQGTYTVTGTDANYCKATSSVVVNKVVAPQRMTISAAGPFCNNLSSKINVTPTTFTKYTWYKDNVVISGVTSSSYTPSTLSSDAGSHIYKVITEDANICGDTNSVTVDLKTAPTVDFPDVTKAVCSDKKYALTATETGSADTYTWQHSTTSLTPKTTFIPSTPSLTDTVTLANRGPGIYKLTASKSGCSSSDSVTVTFNTVVKVDITDIGATKSCDNNLTQLKVINSPAYTKFTNYVWKQNGSVIPTANGNTSYTPTTDGTYTLEVLDEFSCASSDNAIIDVVAVGKINLGSNTSVCTNTGYKIQVNVTSGAFTSYTWKKDNLPFPAAGGATSYAPKVGEAGTYRVIATNANSCKDSSSVTITSVNAPTRIALDSIPTKVCSNSNFQLQVKPSNLSNYAWYLGVSIAPSSSNTSTYTPTSTGTYRVVSTDGNGCKDTVSANIVYVVAETFSLGTDPGIVCTNTNYKLTVPSKFNNIVWKFNNLVISPAPSNPFKPTTAQSNGTIKAEAKDGNGCLASDDIFIAKIVDSTTLSLSGITGVVCSNVAQNINVSPNSLPSYSWFLGTTQIGGATSASYSPKASGTYKVIATDGNGCFSSASTLVAYADTLNITLPNPPGVLCANDTNYTITPTGVGFTSYVLKLDNSTISFNRPPISHKPYLDKVVGNKIYLVEATAGNGCISRASVKINYKDTANFQLNRPSNVVCDNTNGQNTTFTFNAGSGYTSYVWTVNNAPIVPAVTGANYTPSPGAAGKYKYKVVITDVNGCKASDTATVNYFIPLTMTLTSSPSGNIACWNTKYTLTPAIGFNTYDWTTTASGVTIPINTFAYKPTKSGTYTVIGTDPNTCKSSASRTITYVPNFKLDLGKVKAVCTNTTYQIDVSQIPDIKTYKWDNSVDPAFNPKDLLSPIFPNITKAGLYSVELTDINGCIDQDTLDFQIVAQLPINLGKDSAVCQGNGEFILNATSNYAKYVWTNTAGLPNPAQNVSTFKVTKAGTYSVTVYADNSPTSCFNSDAIIITNFFGDLGFELSNPTSATICSNTKYPERNILAKDTLKFNTGYDWTWTVPSGETQPGNVVTFPPNKSGQFIVVVRDKTNHCLDSDTTNITFSNEGLDFDLGDTIKNICFNVVDSISSTNQDYRKAPYKWSWKTPMGASTNTVIFPNKTGKYVAVLTNQYLCTAKDSVNVQFSDSLKGFDLGDPTAKICKSVIVKDTIKALDSKFNQYTWKWTVPSGQPAPGNVSKVLPLVSGTFTVEVKDGLGCKVTDSKNIDYLTDLFGFKIKAPKNTICFNDILEARTLKTDSSKYENKALYTWAWKKPASSNAKPLDSTALVVDYTGTYIATIVNNVTKCDNADTVSVVFSDSLKNLAFKNASSIICFNDKSSNSLIESKDAKYNNLLAYTWVWTVPAPFADPGNVSSIKPTVSGLYTAEVTDKLGCKAKANASILYDSTLIKLSLGPDSAIVCFNDLKTFTDTLYTGPNYAWSWTIPSGSGITVLTDSKIIPDISGDYRALVTKLDTKCSNKDSVNITYSNDLLGFKFRNVPSELCSLTDTIKNKIYAESVKYQNSINYKWVWTVPSGVDTSGKYFVIPTKSGPYSATVYDAWGCSAKASVVINFSTKFDQFDLGADKATICFYSPIQISATNTSYNDITQYTWTWEVDPVSIKIPVNTISYTPKQSGKYKVTLTDSIGCTGFDAVDVIYSDSLLNFGLNNSSDIICFNDSIQYKVLEANLARYKDTSNYKWTWTVSGLPTQFGNLASIYPKASGTYKAVVKDVYGCEASASSQITYDSSLVSFNIGPNEDTVCFNALKTYTDTNFTSNNYTWKWIVPDSSKIKVLNDSKITPDVSGTYKAVVSNKLLCSNKDTVLVHYSDSLLAFKFSKLTDDICNPNDTANKITADNAKYLTANYTWSWTVPKDAKDPGGQNYALPSVTGPYTAVVMDKWKCKASASTQINYANDLVNFNLGDPSVTVCFYENKTIKSDTNKYNNGLEYTWKWETNNGVVIPDGTISYDPKLSGKYKVTIKNSSNCVGADSVTVTFSDSLLAFNLGDISHTICFKPSASDSLKATDRKYDNTNIYKWLWSGPVASTDAKVLPTQGGIYKATVADNWGCKVSDEVDVKLSEPINLGLNGKDTTACSYTGYKISPGAGFAKYEWNVIGVVDSFYYPISSGLYKVKVTNALGCTAEDSVNVTYIASLQIGLPPDKTVCVRTEKNYEISASQGFDSYQWQNLAPSKDFTYKDLVPNFTELSRTTVITLTVYKAICKATASAKITFINTLDPKLGNDTIVCLGSPVYLSPGVFDGYAWHHDARGDTIISRESFYTAVMAGTYTVDLSGPCDALNPSIVITNPDTIKFSFSKDSTFCVGNKLVKKDSLMNSQYIYTWFNRNIKDTILSGVGQYQFEFDETNVGPYKVTIENKYGCDTSVYVTTSVNEDCFMIPNLITPNDDGHNDFFVLSGTYKKEWSLEIYNRWGDKVYANPIYENNWNASGLSDGVYYYTVKNARKNKEYKGWVQVSRGK